MGLNGAGHPKLSRGGIRTNAVRTAPPTPRRRFRDLVEAADAVLWEADPQTLRLSFITGRAESLFGYPLDRWLASADFLRKIVLEGDRETLRHRSANMRDNGGTVEYRVRTADDRIIWIREAIRVTQDQRGQRSGVHGAMVDITELREAEDVTLRLQSMLEANVRAAAVAHDDDAGPAPTADEEARPRFLLAIAAGVDDLLDPSATARRVARAFGESLSLGFVAIARHDPQASSVLAWWPTEVARREHPGPCELLAALDALDGSVPFVPLHVRCAHVPTDVGAIAALPLVDGAGDLIGAIAIGAQDRPWFAEPFRMECRWYALQMGKALSVSLRADRLAAGVSRDPLTGLLQRDAFYARFAQELSRAARTGTNVSLLRWDLVGFDAFNARHGRRLGDRALRAFADAVRAELRRYDVAGRVDGDGLAALLFVNTHQDAHIAAARIQKRAALTRVGDVFIPFPARGFALYPDDGADVAALERVSLVRLGNHRDARLAFMKKDEPPAAAAD